MFSALKRKIYAFLASNNDIIEWYGRFAPLYDKIAWQIEIILRAKATKLHITRGKGGYPRRFVRDVMNRQLDSVFDKMLPRFAGSGRKKTVYAFGKRIVVKLSLEHNALSGDFSMYKFACDHRLACLPRLISSSPDGTSMLCEYASPPDEKWFTKKFGIPCGKICRLPGICVAKETPSTAVEADFVEKTNKRIDQAYASFDDMRILISNVHSSDIIDNEDNWGVIKRNGMEIPVLIDCST